MIKLLRLALYIVICFSSSIVCAQFPYIESFKNSTAPGITFGGVPSAFLTAGGDAYNLETQTHTGTPIDANGNGYLRLTNRLNNQKGYIYSNSIFPSTQGLTVEFEYYIYGGSGADGISFFLYDATAAPFNIGGFGGSLGYAQINTTIPVSPGVSKGYLAIGLDEFGNFSNPTEGRQGGIEGLRPGSVTLRGKGDGAALVAGNYDYLTSVRTADLNFSLVGDPNARRPNTNSAGYRKVLMNMEPNPKGGYNITVRISRGGPTVVTTTVIDNFHYPEIAPQNLRYGIASSTGDQTNFHEIRNVFIDVLDANNLAAPVASNDVLTTCQGNSVILHISENDRTENEGGQINKAAIDLDPTLVGLQNTYRIAGTGVFTISEDNNVLFSPEPAFTGTATASYNIKDTYGKTSNNATITVTVVAGPPQANAGADQFLNSNNTPVSYTLQGNAPGAGTGQWTQVSGPTTAVFVNSALFDTQVNNLASGTYIFRWTLRSANGCESSDEVQLFINQAAVANNDQLSTLVNKSAAILILNNDTDPDGNSTIDPGSIEIVTQPQHGTLSVDLLTGLVTYTPIADFTGADFFEYTVKDNYAVVSNIATVNITVNLPPLPASIGLSKALTSKTKNIDGSHDLTYTFNLVNFGDIDAIYNVSLTDDLAGVFKNNNIVVKRLTATGNLHVNPGYNGFSVKEMLLLTSNLSAKTKEQVILEFNVTVDQAEGTFNNIAFTEGKVTSDGSITKDQSTDGLVPDPDLPGDFTPAKPTPVTINKADLLVPGGFSPNNDGINDYFVIENAGNLQIHLEVFNRWGNRIYRSANYKNEWNGKTTEGIHIGDDVPVGTYYYIIKVDGKNRKVGHLTINR